MRPQTLISAQEVARRLNVDRSTITRRVQAGSLSPAGKLDGATGAYVFDADEIDRMIQKKRAGQEQRAGKVGGGDAA